MSFLRVVIVIAVLGLGVRWWNQHREATALARVTDPHGFVPVPMPDGASDDAVLILAPENCPREGAQRAAAISEGLTALGIPNVRTSHYGAQAFAPTDENLAAFKRLNIVMTGEIPIVLVKGMGKANATLEDTVSEYRKAR